MLSILASAWIYPEAPRLLWAAMGAAALIPTTIILRRLIERHLFPILNALVVFYFIDLLRPVTASQQLVSRLLFLSEMLGGLLFLLWLVKSLSRSNVPEGERTPFMENYVVGGAHRAVSVCSQLRLERPWLR